MFSAALGVLDHEATGRVDQLPVRLACQGRGLQRVIGRLAVKETSAIARSSVYTAGTSCPAAWESPSLANSNSSVASRFASMGFPEKADGF